MSDFESMQQYERLKAALSEPPGLKAPRQRLRFLQLFRPHLHQDVSLETPPQAVPEQLLASNGVAEPERPKTYYFNAAGWTPPEGELDLDYEAD